VTGSRSGELLLVGGRIVVVDAGFVAVGTGTTLVVEVVGAAKVPGVGGNVLLVVVELLVGAAWVFGTQSGHSGRVVVA
jgi:hypothetical protein